jgi:hypothetical protein
MGTPGSKLPQVAHILQVGCCRIGLILQHAEQLAHWRLKHAMFMYSHQVRTVPSWVWHDGRLLQGLVWLQHIAWSDSTTS